MWKARIALAGMVAIMAGCAKTPQSTSHVMDSKPAAMKASPGSYYAYAAYVRPASARYGVDERLVRSIIEVESGFNPMAVSKSNAIGLMQIKSDTSGKDVFRLKGKPGQPTRSELMDPAHNIDIGTAYLSILQNQHLAGIKNPQTMRYAVIVAYANGAGALLRTISQDRELAIKKINTMTPQEFYQHVRKKHPAPQAPRYLDKVDMVYTGRRPAK